MEPRAVVGGGESRQGHGRREAAGGVSESRERPHRAKIAGWRGRRGGGGGSDDNGAVVVQNADGGSGLASNVLSDDVMNKSVPGNIRRAEQTVYSQVQTD